MLSYIPLMPNTKSAKKAVRGSRKKQLHNLSWKRRIKKTVKNIDLGLKEKETAEMLKEKLTLMQKVLDKASKEKVLHKNRVNRLKSKYAKKVTALSAKAKGTKASKNS
jgi:ribosomal protein S20